MALESPQSVIQIDVTLSIIVNFTFICFSVNIMKVRLSFECI